jgi:hypothetical protein
MTQTPIDPLSDEWMDNIQAETSTPPSLKTLNKMTTKKSSALATRGLDSFKMFQAKEFVSGYQNLVTINRLINPKYVVGLFVSLTSILVVGLQLKITSQKVLSCGTTSKPLAWHLIPPLKKV